MKSPPFEYNGVRSVDEAVALLAEHGADTKVLAGRQSLLPLLSLRLARPARLIDVNAVIDLAQGASKELTIGIDGASAGR